jgi:serine/threonine-protein kinase
VLAPGQRPVPEYELVARLGAGVGTYGVVWKAVGPGDFPLALKFMRLEGRAGDFELRALEVMKTARHAHLLPVFGTWQRGDELIIAMELADGNLLDRLRQAQADGHPGIPRDELLGYLREAAEVLDFLHGYRAPGAGGAEAAGVLHKDVKPQNLLLAGGTVKVGDSGLARLLKDYTDHGSRLTCFRYNAPEFLAGRPTPRSDQYSLAMTYCQLRGGRLPFEPSSLWDLVTGNVSRPPDLSMMPEAERPAVARALAKKPEDRWPSCREFVKALQAVNRPEPRWRAAAVPGPPRPWWLLLLVVVLGALAVLGLTLLAALVGR